VIAALAVLYLVLAIVAAILFCRAARLGAQEPEDEPVSSDSEVL